jgi:hypothetical protein
VIRSYLWNPTIDAFEIHLPDLSPRKPDGWFHPSTHPTWDERLLYYYMVNHEHLVPVPHDPHSTMAIVQGHFWHELIGHVLNLSGLLITHDDPRAQTIIDGGGTPEEADNAKVEWKFVHESTRTRGAVDGLLPDEIYEFKTMDDRKAARIPTGAVDSFEVVEAYKELAPGYYAQAQEYMRMSGYRRHRTVLLSLAYPFPMREIVLRYDEHFAANTALKYERVLRALAEENHQMTFPACCAVGSATAKSCLARTICPVGMLSL